MENIKKIFSLLVFVCLLLVLSLGVNTYAANIKSKVFSTQIKPQVPNSVILNGDGTIRIFGAKVVSSGKDTLTTESEINGKFFSFKIKRNEETKVLTSNQDTSFGGIEEGNILSITGVLESFSSNLTVLAKEIRVKSDVKKVEVENATSTEEATSTEVTLDTASSTNETASSTPEIIEASSTDTTSTEDTSDTATSTSETATSTEVTLDTASSTNETASSTPEIIEASSTDATSTEDVLSPQTILEAIIDVASTTIQNIVESVTGGTNNETIPDPSSEIQEVVSPATDATEN